MAAGYLHPVGTEYGPCENEDCGHDVCIDLRKMGACVCRICDKPIGHGSRFYLDGEGRDWYQLVHEICLLTEIENERNARKGE